MLNRKCFLLLLLLLSDIGKNLPAQTHPGIAERKAFSIGESIAIHSNVLGEERRLNIYLPNGYSPDSMKKYPVIYLLDGSVDEDFIHISGLVQFGSFPWINMLPECIVVGIANVDRKRDFTFPTHIEKEKHELPTSGGSEQFIRFLEEEVLPLVDRAYHTDSVRTIIGQSLGGLLASEILQTKPSMFSHYIIISPSLWWDEASLLNLPPTALLNGTSVYIAVGKEGEMMEQSAKGLYEKLKPLEKGRTRIYYQYFDQLDHGDALHLAVYDAFEKLFREERK